jgi:hypothetical protein
MTPPEPTPSPTRPLTPEPATPQLPFIFPELNWPPGHPRVLPKPKLKRKPKPQYAVHDTGDGWFHSSLYVATRSHLLKNLGIENNLLTICGCDLTDLKNPLEKKHDPNADKNLEARLETIKENKVDLSATMGGSGDFMCDLTCFRCVRDAIRLPDHVDENVGYNDLIAFFSLVNHFSDPPVHFSQRGIYLEPNVALDDSYIDDTNTIVGIFISSKYSGGFTQLQSSQP